MIPTLFSIGPLPIHSFGLMMVLCFLAAWRILWLELVAAGENGELAEKMITWAAVGGILGARIGFLLSFPVELMRDPWGTIFGGAGFVFLWGFIGGAGAVYYLIRKEKLSVLAYADLAAPALSIGYAVGRIGCQLSGDGDYGMPSLLPWAIGYPFGVVPTEAGVLVHPTPVYETLLALLLAWYLLRRRDQQHPAECLGSGWRMGNYLVFSSFARILVEFCRIEPVWLTIGPLNLTQAQIISLFLAAFGFYLWGRSPWKCVGKKSLI